MYLVKSFNWRHRRPLLCALGLAFWLAACGGGSDSSNGTDAGGGGGGGGGGDGAESATLLADIELAPNGIAALRVWDPARPTTEVASLQGPVSAIEQVQYGWARSFDVATRTERRTARTLAIHSGNGHAWLTDLRGGQSHTPRQLSSLDLVDRTLNVVPLSLDGSTAWANVMRTGLAFAVHSSMSSTATALRGNVLAALPDSTGAGRYIVLATSDDAGQSGLSVLAADGSGLGFTPVSGGFQGIRWMGFDPVQAGRGYVLVNQQLLRLLWTDSGVSLDPSFNHAMLSVITTNSVADATGLWLLDGASLLHIVGDSVTTRGAFADAPSKLWDAGDAVLAVRSVPLVPQCCNVYEAMDKTTGAITEVSGGVNSAIVFAVGDGKALFRQAGGWGWLLRDMQGQVLSQGSGPILGAVNSAERIAGRVPALQGFLACTQNPSTGLCGAGPVSQFGLDGMAQLTLTELTAGTTLNLPMQQAFVAGLPTSMATLGANPSSRDLWQFTPGVAGSLQRVTTHLP